MIQQLQFEFKSHVKKVKKTIQYFDCDKLSDWILGTRVSMRERDCEMSHSNPQIYKLPKRQS
jgi:hypothetical protein